MRWRSRRPGRLPLPLVLGIGLLGVGILAVVGVALIFALLVIRPFGAGTGANLEGLSLVERDATVYLTFYHPAAESDPTGGGCKNGKSLAASGTQYLYRQRGGGETVNPCTTDGAAKQSDDNYELITLFNDGRQARGGIAVNHPAGWLNGAAFPLGLGDRKQARAGNTYWLQLPGYQSDSVGVPVVDNFAVGQTRRHARANGGGWNYKYRVDLAVKGPAEQAALETVWCNQRAPEFGACIVRGVTVYRGNPGSSGSGSTGNGLARTPRGFPRFLQYEGPWAGQVYGKKCNGQPTVSQSGCGPSSLANVVLYYLEQGKIQLSAEYQQEFGSTVNPGTVATLSERHGYRVCNAGTAYSMFDSVGSRYFGLRGTSASWPAVVTALRQGIPVIASMKPGYFTSGGHFVTLYGIDEANDKVFVSDTYTRNRTEAPLATARDEAKIFIIMTPRP